MNSIITIKNTNKKRAKIKLSKKLKILEIPKNMNQKQKDIIVKLANMALNMIAPYLWGSATGNFLFPEKQTQNCILSIQTSSKKNTILTVGLNNNKYFYKKGAAYEEYKQQMDKHFEKIILRGEK